MSGRVGTVVTYQWRGKWCVRSLPSQYTDAQTDAQLSQRRWFKLAVGFASRARQVIVVGLRQSSLKAQMTEYNYFMRINRQCMSVDDNGRLSVDYENLILSEGPVAPVAFDAPQIVDDTTISIGFDKNPLRKVAKPNDSVFLVAYCPSLDQFDISAPAYRRYGSLEMRFLDGWSGREVHLWGFVKDQQGRCSQSLYVGCGVLSVDAGQEAVASLGAMGGDGLSVGKQGRRLDANAVAESDWNAVAAKPDGAFSDADVGRDDYGPE